TQMPWPAGPEQAAAPTLAESPPSPPTPALFWFHADDTSPNPEPAYKVIQYLITGRDSTRNNIGPVAAPASVAAAAPGPVTPAQPASPRSHFLEYYWLAARLPHQNGNQWIVCRALGIWGTRLGMPLLDELKENLPSLPPWLDYTAEIAGHTLAASTQAGATGRPINHKSTLAPAPEILASAVRHDDGVEQLRVSMRFVNPELFYLRQRTRTRLFGALI